MTGSLSSCTNALSPGGEITCFPRSGRSPDNAENKPLHLAVGMFDGVHLGHQAVIRQAIMAAGKDEGHCSGVLTFDPHPSQVLYPKMATRLLLPLRKRIRDIHEVGVDFVFVQEFSREYAQQDAKSFVPALLKNFPDLKSIHVGENFRFGAGRSGNVDTLRISSAENGVELHALQRKVMDGMAISSSRIRAALMEGSLHEVNAMLGKPYTISGSVVSGKGIGHKLGFPTLNIPWAPEISPRYGVYMVKLRQRDSRQSISGIANYGLRPTVEDSTEPLFEVHLLEVGPVPGPADEVEVQLLQFIRPEKAFDSLDDLKSQIEKDVSLVKTRWSTDSTGC